MTPYRTLVFAHLVQESALALGGNRPHEIVDLPLARDGLGRPVLRGTTLAGLFLSRARDRFESLPAVLVSPQPEKNGDPLPPSAWRFAHAHPCQDIHSAFYQHVSIDRRTGAARDDHLFDLEAIARGTVWDFQLELVPPKEPNDWALVEGMAARVLEDWSIPGGIHIGHGSRHGYGWAHLEDLRMVRLYDDHWPLWPDALEGPETGDAWVERFQASGVPILDLSAFVQQSEAFPERSQGRVTLTGTVEVGLRAEGFGAGYGVDSLSIGGHARLGLETAPLFERLVAPPQIPFSREAFDPDFTITLTPNTSGTLEPYLPGASLRGVWRAALERHLRATGGDFDPIEFLFGSTERAGALAVADGTLEGDYRLLWQQHVAIDEFTGGAYGSNKFDRLALLQGRFRWRAVVTAPTQEEAEAQADYLRRLLITLGEGHLPLGGGIWRGHGHVRWQLDHLSETEEA